MTSSFPFDVIASTWKNENDRSFLFKSNISKYSSPAGVFIWIISWGWLQYSYRIQYYIHTVQPIQAHLSGSTLLFQREPDTKSCPTYPSTTWFWTRGSLRRPQNILQTPLGFLLDAHSGTRSQTNFCYLYSWGGRNRGLSSALHVLLHHWPPLIRTHRSFTELQCVCDRLHYSQRGFHYFYADKPTSSSELQQSRAVLASSFTLWWFASAPRLHFQVRAHTDHNSPLSMYITPQHVWEVDHLELSLKLWGLRHPPCGYYDFVNEKAARGPWKRL